MVLRSRKPRQLSQERGGDGGEGAGGGTFIGTPSAVSRALPPAGLLTVSIMLSVTLIALVTAAIVG